MPLPNAQSLRFYQDKATTAKLEQTLSNFEEPEDTTNDFFTSHRKDIISLFTPKKVVELRNHTVTTANELKPHAVLTKLSFHEAVNKPHKHVLPRAAYFDQRKRGQNINTTVVILAHVNKTVVERNLIISCIVDGQPSKSFKVQTMKLNEWIHRNHPECSHDNVFVLCYNAPTCNNSRVSLGYINPDNTSEHFVVESEHDVYIPLPTIKPENDKNNKPPTDQGVMVCTTMYGSPPYFLEWLRYQMTLNVSMVYINAQESFTKSTVFNDTFFQQLLGTDFVQMKVWREYLSKKEVFYHSQALYYQNCIYRFQGVYEYAVMADTDDFLIPRGADLTRTSLHQYLNYILSLN